MLGCGPLDQPPPSQASRWRTRWPPVAARSFTHTHHHPASSPTAVSHGAPETRTRAARTHMDERAGAATNGWCTGVRGRGKMGRQVRARTTTDEGGCEWRTANGQHPEYVEGACNEGRRVQTRTADTAVARKNEVGLDDQGPPAAHPLPNTSRNARATSIDVRADFARS